MDKFCFSCGMPVCGETASTSREDYCKFCVDEHGKLQPREVVQQGIAEWLKGINPADTKGNFLKRADLYMQAMPEWAE